MAKTKLTPEERTRIEKDLAVLRRAVQQCEHELHDDDAASKAVETDSDRATISQIAKRDGTAAAILAARELGRRGGPQG